MLNIKASRAVILLTLLFLASVAGRFIVEDAVGRTVEAQAQAIAEVVASHAATGRSVYSREIVKKLERDGFGPSEDSAHLVGFVPIPAQFLRMVGEDASRVSGNLYSYKPVSKWNLGEAQGLEDDFLRWGWAQLEAQDQSLPQQPVSWKPVFRLEDQNGVRVLRYLVADPASQASCVACHNQYEKRPDVMARRNASGVALGKQWTTHQLLGALSVTVPLDKAQAIAGVHIEKASFFISGVILVCFVALLWLHLRLNSEQRHLLATKAQLQLSETEINNNKLLLQAKQGVEDTLAELSTYLHGIDQHALVTVTDAEGRILTVNDRVVLVSGYQREELVGVPYLSHQADSANALTQEMVSEALVGGEVWRGLMSKLSKAGNVYFLDTAIVTLRNSQGQRQIVVQIDVSERIRAEQEWVHAATHDGLTGLPNRQLLRDRLAQLIESSQRAGTMAALMFIDLDGFKGINDNLGHAVGDKLLVAVAQRLSDNLRKMDTVARQGGDEFVVALSNVYSRQDMALFATNLVQKLHEPYLLSGQELMVGASIGIALFPSDGKDVETLLKKSDAAMYRVKATCKSGFLFFDDQ